MSHGVNFGNPSPGSSLNSAGFPSGARRGRRGRNIETPAQRLVESVANDSCDAHGVVNQQQVIEILRRSLEMVDPEYQRAKEARALVDCMRHRLACQGKDSISKGVKRALADIVMSGAGAGTYTVATGCAMIGVSRKGKQERREERRCTSDSFARPRKKNKLALGVNVAQAVREFALCYCKYEEKTYVSVLSAYAVWELYCVYHDKQGRFFFMGTSAYVRRNVAAF